LLLLFSHATTVAVAEADSQWVLAEFSSEALAEVAQALEVEVQAVDSVVLAAAALEVVAPAEVGSFLGALTGFSLQVLLRYSDNYRSRSVGFSLQSLARIQVRINSLLRKINLRLDLVLQL
jgi:hypothetical protein